MSNNLGDYRTELLKDLKNPNVASEYLTEILQSNSLSAMLVALKDVIDANGGVAKIADESKLTKHSMYKMLSEKGNPYFASIVSVSEALGMDIKFIPHNQDGENGRTNTRQQYID